MLLHQIGENELLGKIRKRFNPSPEALSRDVIIGIGDDAAVIAPQSEKIFVTTDMMNEGVHFDLSFAGPLHLGFKLVTVNVSDIMAMGGTAKYLFLSLALKKDTDEAFFWSLYDGISLAMAKYRLFLLGGDLCAAEHGMVLSATVLGTGRKVIARKGASAGDKIYVTGNLGDAACGLELLRRCTDESKELLRHENLLFPSATISDDTLMQQKRISIRNKSVVTDLAWGIARPLIVRHLMPVARDARPHINYATAMMDISDGLFMDLSRMCDESGIGVRLYLDRLPLSGQMRSVSEMIGCDPLSLATAGGEDYELLFTAPEAFSADSEGVKVTCIGEITEKDRIVIDCNGRQSYLVPEGYQHFGIS